jgi:oleandomycin transport system permease protein
MSTLDLPIERPRVSALPAPVRQSLSLAWRTLLRIRRTPEQLLDVTLQPPIFIILFVYVFGGAIAGTQHDYLQYVLPSLMVQTVIFGTIAIGANLNDDIKNGVFDRFRSLPISRSAPLVGAVFGDVIRYSIAIVVTLAFGMALGFRVSTNPLEAFAACLLTLGFALCLCWVSIFVGMLVRESGAVQGLGFLFLFPLTFGSTTFVKAETMPGWLQAWVKVNPITHLNEAVRNLMIGGPVAGPVAWSIGWALLFLVVFAPLAVRAYRRKA